MNTLSKIMREKRGNRTLKEMEKVIGLNFNTISRIERGTNLGPKSVKALSKYLKISISEVYELYENNK